ncbi:MAG: FmdB family zinc ribbon protein [Thermodesulfobacteriota bacterium]|jgi:putative FmdB family regulatory protein
MPIYEYECQSCQEVVEKWQSLAEQPLTTCPSCAGPLKKLISQSSFQLKGGGWYADGYGNSGGGAKKCAASADSSSGSSSSTSSAPACGKAGSCGCC